MELLGQMFEWKVGCLNFDPFNYFILYIVHEVYMLFLSFPLNTIATDLGFFLVVPMQIPTYLGSYLPM